MAHFTIQDILGSTIAFILFILIFVFPGYVSGWTINLLSFRKRRPIVRFVLAIVFSFAISPILLFLAVRLLSSQFALGILFTFSIVFAIILWRTTERVRLGVTAKTDGNLKSSQKRALAIVAGWSIFAILFLVDWQSQNRLWLNSVSYDYSTRVQVIQAITRTGAPPVNPSYYPGHPVKLTFLYYFWYVLCSLIDQLGGNIVSARTALIASVAWCGLGMMATIAIYLRLRGRKGCKAWNSALLGIGSLTISGLDIFPALFFLIGTQILFGRIALQLPGDIEHWNEQITAWISSFAWVPHHVAAVIACLVGMMIWQSARRGTFVHRITAAIIAGFGFASALGLSVWVTVIFAVFWGMWMLTQFLQRERSWPMLLSGLVAILAVLPFLLDMLNSESTGSGGGFPVGLSVRAFWPLAILLKTQPVWKQSLINFLALPINYLLELGFFFLVAILWPILVGKERLKSNPYFRAEILLLLVVVGMVTFIRSTVISNNDFGWRGWLFGQFILLIWGVDILEYFRSAHIGTEIKVFRYRIPVINVKPVLTTFMFLGISTTVLSLLALRFWTVLVDAGVANYPDQFRTDMALGQKTYNGRQAFEYVNKNTPQKAVVQFNPRVLLDYPTGLYLTRQSVISTHTLYGVSNEQYRKLMSDIGMYFSSPQDWQALSRMCRQYNIDILVLRSTDPLWENLDVLKVKHPPLYINQHDAVFACNSRN